MFPQLRDSEQSTLQKDRKIKDLQERLTMMIKQNMQPVESRSRKKSLSIDEVPMGNSQSDNTSTQFVYYSGQRRSSVSPGSYQSVGKRT